MNKLLAYINALMGSYAKRGFLRTLKYVYGEYIFDIKFHTNTKPILNNSNMIMSGMESNFGSNWLVLKNVFRFLMTEGLINPKDTHMIDYGSGSGSGRAMIAACYFGINRITGVEFNKSYCALAQKNLEKLYAKNKRRNFTSNNSIILNNSDAATFEIPQGANLFYLYNPFSSPTIQKVVDLIKKYSLNCKLTIVIVYVNPVFDELFSRHFRKLDNSDDDVAYYVNI